MTDDAQIEASSASAGSRATGRIALRIGAAVLAVAGLAAVGVGALAFVRGTNASGGTSSTAAPTPSATASAPSPTPSATAATDADALDIADLADPDWVATVAGAAGIPERAMRAYAGAELAVRETHPDCGVGWNTLAGVGFVESEHGSIGGAAIAPDGVTSPAIVGIPLDGTESEAIADTDSGALDGDTEWDRAVGPMQFIPQTWVAYGRDGNGDGVVDPHHIDDAALSAAAYLCDAGGDLTQPANWIAAIAAYNSAAEYNNRVAAAADAYTSVPQG